MYIKDFSIPSMTDARNPRFGNAVSVNRVIIIRCAPPGYTYAFIPDSCAPTLSHGLSVRLDCLEPISNEETRLSSDFFLSPEREPENSPKMESFGATKTLDEGEFQYFFSLKHFF